MPKLTNKPTTAYLTALTAAGYGISYETNSGNAEYHRLPTKDVDGNDVYNDVYNDVPVDLVAITALSTAHIEQYPLLTQRQYIWFLHKSGLTSALDLRIAQLGANGADLLLWFKYPTGNNSYDKVYSKLNSLKAELKLLVPLLSDSLFSATNLEKIWTDASKIGDNPV